MTEGKVLPNKTSGRLIAVFALLAVVAGVWWGLRATPQVTKHPLEGLSFQTTEGTSTKLSGMQNKVVVLNFWATWCPPCLEEMPEINALYPELQSKNIQLLGIAIDSPSNIRNYLKKMKIDYPLYAGGFGGAELASQFGNSNGGLPYTVVLGKDGTVLWTKQGRVHANEIQAAIQGL